MAGERRALSRAITLAECTDAASRKSTSQLFSLIVQKPSLRVAVSGAPGAGKSTLIESLGSELVNNRGRKLAVLAVDPSSQLSGGSILGDKTRMNSLSSHPSAYIRPSPSRGVLGGVARQTEDCVALCESAGYDNILIETVGVGQSEVAAAELADIFLLILPPAAGDALQGIKRGIMELADLVVVSKADGDLVASARTMANDVRGALRVMRSRSAGWSPQVILSSSKDAQAAGRVADKIEECRVALEASGELALRRGRRARASVWSHAREEWLEYMEQLEGVGELREALSSQVCVGKLTSREAGKLLAQRAWEKSSKFGQELERDEEFTS